METLLDRMRALRSRPVGWDGEGGVPPSSAAIRDGEAFLKLLQSEGVPMPEKVFAPGDGELTFQWKARGYCETAFAGDRSISWGCKSSSERLWGDDAFWWEEPRIPLDLLDYMKRMN